jgi:hypothetical protein
VAKEQAAELPISYIVRIYRSEPPDALTGTVEVPELAKQLTFASFDELKSILVTTPTPER